MGEMLMDYFWIIFNVLLIVALIYWVFRSYKSKKYNKILFVISVIVSVILIIPLLNGIVSNADSIIHPTPFLKLRSKNVHINGTHTKGVLYGETLSNSKVILKDADGIDDNIIVKSNGNGTFKATGLDDRTDYKVTAQKNGKKSNSVKVSVSDIPDSAYTKFHIKNANDMGSLTLNDGNDNTVSVSGTASPHSTIKITDPDMNYSVVKTLHVKSDGKWATTLNGPGTGENDKKEKEYDFSAKVKNRATKDDDSIFIENPNHKKKQDIKSNTAKSSDSETDNSSSSNGKVPTEYKSALRRANGYAKVMNMSQQGIYDQLTSQVADGFSAEAAQYAVDNVKANWDENALKKAKDYQDKMSMSPNDIQEQLTSQSGEKFTQEQADYAIQHLND
jgi:hypothetical protein